MPLLTRTFASLLAVVVVSAYDATVPPVCPNAAGTTLFSRGNQYLVSCGTDFSGGDIGLTQTDTNLGCLSVCGRTSGCVAVSYSGRNCYLKGSANNPVVNANIISFKNTGIYGSYGTAPPPASPSPCPTDFTCPANDGCIYQDPNGRTITVTCGYDYYGGDLLLIQTSGLARCTAACAKNSMCVAASYSEISTGYGNCYLKSKNGGGNINDNINGVYLDSQTSTLPSSTPSSSSASPTPTSSSSSATPTPSAVQVVQDPGFESGQQPKYDNSGSSTSPWGMNEAGEVDVSDKSKVTIDSTTAHTGTYSWRAQGEELWESWLAEVSQIVNVVEGTTYAVQVWSKQAKSDNCVVEATWDQATVFSFEPALTWTSGAGTLTASFSNSSLAVTFMCGSGGADTQAWLDDITVTAVA